MYLNIRADRHFSERFGFSRSLHSLSYLTGNYTAYVSSIHLAPRIPTRPAESVAEIHKPIRRVPQRTSVDSPETIHVCMSGGFLPFCKRVAEDTVYCSHDGNKRTKRAQHHSVRCRNSKWYYFLEYFRALSVSHAFSYRISKSLDLA